MTDEPTRAVEWLQVLAMLAEPRLPKEHGRAAIDAMVRAVKPCLSVEANSEAVYRALYDHLSKPATRSVHVWRVEYSFHATSGTWVPQCAVYMDEGYARRFADWARTKPDHACVTVTGPHNQETPE